MAEYTEEKKVYKDAISIMHYNDKTQMYKVLASSPTDQNDAMFFSIRQGFKGSKGDRLTLMLNKQEIAYLILELQKYYNNLA